MKKNDTFLFSLLSKLNSQSGTLLVIQWLRLCTPNEAAQVRSPSEARCITAKTQCSPHLPLQKINKWKTQSQSNHEKTVKILTEGHLQNSWSLFKTVKFTLKQGNPEKTSARRSFTECMTNWVMKCVTLNGILNRKGFLFISKKKKKKTRKTNLNII